VLSWKNVSGETGYSVERKAANGTTYAEVAKIPVDVRTWKDVTTVAQTYSYRVRAYKTRNGSTIYSSYSNVISITTVDPNSDPGCSS
jgi:hypothetical protein